MWSCSRPALADLNHEAAAQGFSGPLALRRTLAGQRRELKNCPALHLADEEVELKELAPAVRLLSGTGASVQHQLLARWARIHLATLSTAAATSAAAGARREPQNALQPPRVLPTFQSSHRATPPGDKHR
jgi:hypothetical protein